MVLTAIKRAIPYCLLTTNLPSIQIKELAIYPNPAQDFLNISMGAISGAAQVFIVDLMGKTVLSKELQGQQNRLALDGLSSGVYVVLVEMEGIVLRERLVVE